MGASGVGPVRQGLARALRRLRAHDPGYTRARVAAGVVLGTVLGAAPAVALLSFAGGPPQVAVVAVIVAMTGALTVPTAGPAARAAWLARLTLAGGVSAAAAAALSPWPWASYAVFLSIIAGGAWATRWGPAGMATGMVAFNAYTLPLFLDAPPAEAPWLFAAAVAGGLGAALVALVLLPNRPEARLRRLLPAFDARLDRLVEQLLAALAQGVDEPARHRLRALLASLQEVALQVDLALDPLAAGRTVPSLEQLRGEVLWAEVLSDHLVWSVVTRSRTAVPPHVGEARRLRSIWEAPAAEDARGGSVIPVPDSVGPAATAETLGRLAVSRAALWRHRVHARADAALQERPPASSVVALPAVVPLPLATEAPRRKVIQAILAGALAIVLGIQLSPLYWEWAVMGAYIVVLTTPFRGAALRRAFDRTLGTLVGVGMGLALGSVLSGRSSVELVAMIALLFTAFWILQVSYTWMTLLVTMMIALLYDFLGRGASEILLVRLYETALGAGIGSLVAWFVLPSPSRSAIDGALVAVLDALDNVLEGLAAPSDGNPPSLLIDRIRQLDSAVATVRTLTEPLVTLAPVPIAEDVRAARLLATSTRFRARALATAMSREGTEGAPIVDDATASVLGAVRHRLRRLREELNPTESSADLPGKVAMAPGDLGGGTGPVADILRAIDARLVAYLESRR